jgi:hypothetical protein
MKTLSSIKNLLLENVEILILTAGFLSLTLMIGLFLLYGNENIF